MKAQFFVTCVLLILVSCGKGSGSAANPEAAATVPGVKEAGVIQVTNSAASDALPVVETPSEAVVEDVVAEEVIFAPVEVLQDPQTGVIEIVVDNVAEEVLVEEIVEELAQDADLSDLKRRLEKTIQQLEHKLWALNRQTSNAPGKLKEIERTEIELALNQKLLLQVERLLQ